jgi:hypothetical protein
LPISCGRPSAADRRVQRQVGRHFAFDVLVVLKLSQIAFKVAGDLLEYVRE